MTMTKQEAADFLGVTIRAVEGYAAKGKLTPAYAKGQRGNIAVFDEEEVKRLKEEREQVVYVDRPGPMADARQQALVRRQGTLNLLEQLAELIPQKATPDVAIADKLLLKLDEAAKLTGLSRQTLREAIDKEKLKAKMIGRAWRIKRDDLDAYVKKL